ncbi:TetR/AcrR family transcriptional regulator [Gulosibacter chungangensis]|uniref:TetR family transcriptional regulator n=1 Tax=Gulosibacter chungangensis TaxID=979746 RepID=A0A7J5BCA4_9MICO|nr:TetR/AcrR family transcriptional regulator C-terminal domain-containing protein [Gulosibacter chungangensis]KAB1642571.1 TetR family transcriptional regulator [Gulosibacter chungangensis]
MSENANSAPRGRGRPRRSEGAVLTLEAILQRGLEIAGAEGFPALTMNRLARDFEVSPKALYNHVDSRQDVVDGVAALIMQSIPAPQLDATNWKDSLRTAYREGREAYRRFPRATLISLDETVTPGEIDPSRILLAEHTLQFFVDLGLTLEQAITARNSFLLDLFSFTLMIDYRYDSSPAPVREAITQPVPRIWLEALPDVAAPHSREAATLPTPDSDTMFERLVDMRIAAISALLTS